MKRLTIPLFALAFALHLVSAHAETYNLIGQRHLRLYTAPEPTQAYNASVDAQRIADNLCNVPWTPARALDATTTSHVNDQLDENVRNRDQFDAALFCAEHTNGQHRAYANAAVYRYRLPDGALPNLVSLSAKISSDPYNALGARIVLYTNATGEIPMDCATCRGDVTGGIKLAGLAPRITKNVVEGGKTNAYWYPNTTNATFNLSTLQPFNSSTLQRYLFVFVLMENYASSRGNWLEGCSYMENRISITTDAPVPGWIDGDTIDLSKTGSYSAAPDEWMPYFETTNTIVTATKNGVTADFSAPPFAYRLTHFGSTNLIHVTHRVSKFDEETWTRGEAVSNLTGWTVAKVQPSRRVAVSGHDVYIERGYEVDPPSRGTVKSDSDGDGIPDGWEVYVGSDPLDPSDATSDWDGDGLTLSEEYDHGHFPTDPRSVDTDGDLVTDFLAYHYHLKGDDPGKDFDGDGLSNYAEYLADEVLRFQKLDPDRYATSDCVCDYFRKACPTGSLYVGEVFTDHDQIDDEWELKYPTAANAYVYDPFRDDDLDGWSNFAEFKAGTDPTRVFGEDGRAEYPVPTVTMNVRMESTVRHLENVVVKAWSEKTDPEMTGLPDAIWTDENKDMKSTFVLREPSGMSAKSHGHVREGLNTFYCFADENGDGNYTPGEPFGVVRGVDVGWQGAKFTVELTDLSPIFGRINVFDGATAGKSVVVSVQREGSSSKALERTFHQNGRNFICEADFIGGTNMFDVEWGSLSVTADTTNVFYSVTIEGATNSATTTVERRFESKKSRPVVENVEAVCYGARPTFRWSLPDEEPFAKRFGTSYTAFKLQVWSADGKTKIYDSGVRRAPTQDRNGVFSWTADLSASDLTLEGKTFATPGNYKWRVAMYNAKFQPVSDDNDEFSERGSFSIAANTQQEMNDHQYSSIDVAVKYAGPANVIAQYADLTTLKGKVRVQAFATADFAGEPLSETVVTAKVDDFTSVTANVRLVGLDATGTYYIRAYIDSDGDHARSAWESWGAAKTPVVLTTSLRTAPLVGVWIEDTDVDQDWMPDAWEYVKFGTIATESAEVRKESKTIFTTAMEESAKTRLASLSTGLEGASLTIFENGAWAKTLLGWGDDMGDITFDDIRNAVQGQLDVKSGTFKITSLTLGPDGKVTLTVDAEVAPTIAGTLLSTVYDVAPGSTRAVTVKVYRRESLATSTQTLVGTHTVQIGAGAAEIEVNTGLTPENLISGLYEFTVE